ncbi:hypothetical protein NO2_0422 [Candidatus Termititenax persephonae]|uniref:Uncharacterized protein n=1 Tax=Candidatus Termititenax persephonae TaxID=2218525 RepID=A0A388TGJ5_9BACT|nr:hypothetical protein NO2_0422 [Candidatus Termititenax persephonae]
MSKNPKGVDNFEPLKEIQSTLDKIVHPDQFAKVFCNAARTQSSIKDCLSETIRDTLLKDKKFDKYFEDAAKKVIKEDRYYFWVNLSRGFEKIFLVVLGAVITFVFNLFSKKLGV